MYCFTTWFELGNNFIYLSQSVYLISLNSLYVHYMFAICGIYLLHKDPWKDNVWDHVNKQNKVRLN